MCRLAASSRRGLAPQSWPPRAPVPTWGRRRPAQHSTLIGQLLPEFLEMTPFVNPALRNGPGAGKAALSPQPFLWLGRVPSARGCRRRLCGLCFPGGQRSWKVPGPTFLSWKGRRQRKDKGGTGGVRGPHPKPSSLMGTRAEMSTGLHIAGLFLVPLSYTQAPHFSREWPTGRGRLRPDPDPWNEAARLLQVGGGLSSRQGPWLPAGPRPPARARWGGPARPPSPGMHSWGLWWHWPECRCDPSPPGRRGAGRQAGGGQEAETTLPEARGSRTSERLCPGLPPAPRQAPARGARARCVAWPPPRPPAHPDAVVPALTLGLQRPHACSVTHGPPAQTVAPLDFVGDDPDLEHGLAEGLAPCGGTTGTAGGTRAGTGPPPPPYPAPGPTPGPGAPRTRAARCWTRAPSRSPAGSWARPPAGTTGSLGTEGCDPP